MTASEYRDWVAFYEVEPWGTTVDDYRATALFNGIVGSAGGKIVEQERLFPWTKEVYEATKTTDEKARERMEAALDRFFDGHNEREESKSR